MYCKKPIGIFDTIHSYTHFVRTDLARHPPVGNTGQIRQISDCE